ncbi:hypothetical protein AB0H34_34810 [Saccharopolyspora shandongensis]|uniref:hypothetical protein n=1 Tax=Saccharopolyspora shandongensis TaxID=418495 RepID=UPI0033C16662
MPIPSVVVDRFAGGTNEFRRRAVVAIQVPGHRRRSRAGLSCCGEEVFAFHRRCRGSARTRAAGWCLMSEDEAGADHRAKSGAVSIETARSARPSPETRRLD